MNLVPPKPPEPGNEAQVVAVIAVIGVRGGGEFAIGRDGFERRQFPALGRTWYGMDENAVDPTKDRSVGGDAYGQGEHGNQREARAAQQHAGAIVEVLGQSGHGICPVEKVLK